MLFLQKHWGKLLLALIILVTIGAMTNFVITRSQLSNTSYVNAECWVSDTTVNIKNLNTYDWKYVTCTINNFFIYKTETIGSGETRTVNLREFTNGSGERFDSYHYKPVKLVIVARVYGLDIKATVPLQ